MGRIVRAMTRDGWVKIASVDGRDMVQRAKDIHNTSPTATAAVCSQLAGQHDEGRRCGVDHAYRRRRPH